MPGAAWSGVHVCQAGSGGTTGNSNAIVLLARRETHSQSPTEVRRELPPKNVSDSGRQGSARFSSSLAGGGEEALCIKVRNCLLVSTGDLRLFQLGNAARRVLQRNADAEQNPLCISR